MSLINYDDYSTTKINGGEFSATTPVAFDASSRFIGNKMVSKRNVMLTDTWSLFRGLEYNYGDEIKGNA